MNKIHMLSVKPAQVVSTYAAPQFGVTKERLEDLVSVSRQQLSEVPWSAGWISVLFIFYLAVTEWCHSPLSASLGTEQDLQERVKNYNQGFEKKTCWPEIFGGNILSGDQILRKANQIAQAHADWQSIDTFKSPTSAFKCSCLSQFAVPTALCAGTFSEE